MRQLIAGGLLLTCCLLVSRAAAQEISRVCEERGVPGRCDVILVKDGVAYAASERQAGSMSVYKTLGNYRKDLQPLVSVQEAPVHEIRFRSGGRVIVTWAHTKPPRLAGPVFRLHFYSPQSRLQMEADGDISLERLEGGDLFNSSVELLVVTMRAESGPSVITKAWRVEGAKAPESLLTVHGSVQQIQKPHEGFPPGLWIEYVVTGQGGSTDRWIRGFWEWVPQSKRFRWPGSFE